MDAADAVEDVDAVDVDAVDAVDTVEADCEQVEMNVLCPTQSCYHTVFFLLLLLVTKTWYCPTTKGIRSRAG